MQLDKLMRRLKKGDKSVLSEIYNQTKTAVYYTALAILRERLLAEDVMQSTYINVLTSSSSYTDGTNARAWITRIARNLALNEKKRRLREVGVDCQALSEMSGVYELDDYGGLVDYARKSLDDDEFNILMLVAVSGYKRREVAEIMDMSINTVTWKYNQATQKMKKLLNEKEG